VEAVIFRARHENKVSRLKKIMIIDSVPWAIEENPAFIILNKCIKNSTFTSEELSTFYRWSLDLIIKNIGEANLNTCLILKKFIEIYGITVNTENCAYCKNSELIGFDTKKCCFLCEKCCNAKRIKILSKPIAKKLQDLFNDTLKQLSETEFKDIFTILKEIVWHTLEIKLEK
jgi:recombinational DNA repair protein (RecF pathway)